MECSDEELVARCKVDGAGAFEFLFRRYERRVFNLIVRSVGNVDDADDIKQEVFYRAYKSLSSFRGGCRFSTWIYRIAVNLCLDHAKKCKAVTGIADELLEGHIWGGSQKNGADDPEKALQQSELRKVVQSAILSLPPHYRILIVLRHVEELPYEEIAGIVGCSVNALNVRLHRARTALRERVLPYLTAGREEPGYEMQRNKAEDHPTV